MPRKLLWLGVLFAMFFWFLEAFVHSAVFGEGSYMVNLLPQNPNELWMRTLVCSLLIVFGIYAQSTVAELKVSEEERLRLKKELEDSLAKLLSGFIPICANCKDIREENGTWIRIEGYIQRHSDVKFSHGVCQKWAELLYPEYAVKE
jgi:hypothetical protein